MLFRSLQRIPIVFQNAATPSNILPVNYDDTVRWSAGFEWYANKDWTLRLGFAYDETPIQSPQFGSPRVPDNNRYFLGAGFRWSPTHFMDVDFGYAHLFFDEQRVDFTDSQGHELLGKLHPGVDIVSAAVTFRWGGPREVASVMGKDVLGYKK